MKEKGEEETASKESRNDHDVGNVNESFSPEASSDFFDRKAAGQGQPLVLGLGLGPGNFEAKIAV